MKNFLNKKLSNVEAREINGAWTDRCGKNSGDKGYIWNIPGSVGCAHAEFTLCRNQFPSKDIWGAKVDYKNTGKSDITCYWDAFECNGGFIWC